MLNINNCQSNPNPNPNQKSFKQRPLNQQLRLGTGQAGTANGEFNYPRGITFDSKNQRIIIDDFDNHRLQLFNRHDLTHLLSVGTNGTNLGQFIYPAGLCIQPFTNHLLVCDSNNHRVQVWSVDDKVQPIYAIGRTGQPSDAKRQFNRPHGVHCSPDGSFSVVDRNNHRVQRFDASGRFLNTFARQGKDKDQLQYPYDICHLHHHFAPSSSSASSLLLVTDHKNNRLSIWSADGHQHITNIQMKGSPHFVCVDLNGFVHVSFQWPNVVCIYDPRMSYQLLQTLGDQQGSAPGRFNCPAGMCVDDLNTLMVVELGNNRVQFFD